jgi:hypothetical protein
MIGVTRAVAIGRGTVRVSPVRSAMHRSFDKGRETMKQSTLGLGIIAAGALLAASSAADASVVRYSYDFDNFDYFAGNNLVLSTTVPAAAGGLVVDFGWDDIVVLVHDNTDQGAPFEPWASELVLGYTWGEFDGIEWSQPFPGVNQAGQHGPVSASGQHFPGDIINSQGVIELWAVQLWNDGTGLPHGTIISGTLWIDVQQALPAPGALALLGAFGLLGTRRRRA